MKRFLPVVLTSAVVAFGTTIHADEGEDLAKQLANPISSLISLPIQANYDENIGLGEEGSVWRINVQPVLPFSMNDDWNIISRTILPLVDQDDVPSAGMSESGLGDTVQSIFFSPKEPGFRDWIWGIGPVIYLPTATDEALGAERWGIGPTAVALRQLGPWTYGALVNHIADIGGEDERTDLNATFLQPFVSYVTQTKTTVALNLESTYDWESEEWLVPVNLMVNQMAKFGPQIMQLGVGARYWADSPDGAADEWGFRLQATFLYPK